MLWFLIRLNYLVDEIFNILQLRRSTLVLKYKLELVNFLLLSNSRDRILLFFNFLQILFCNLLGIGYLFGFFVAIRLREEDLQSF